MSVKASDIKAKKIIDAKTGVEVGVADDIFFDEKENKVKAILIGIAPGFENTRAIELKDVESVGPDAVVIKDSSSIVNFREKYYLASNENEKEPVLVDSQLITKDGNNVGKLVDLEFDLRSGKLKKAKARQNNQTKEVEVNKVLSAGGHNTVVDGGIKGEEKGILEKLEETFTKVSPNTS